MIALVLLVLLTQSSEPKIEILRGKPSKKTVQQQQVPRDDTAAKERELKEKEQALDAKAKELDAKKAELDAREQEQQAKKEDDEKRAEEQKKAARQISKGIQTTAGQINDALGGR